MLLRCATTVATTTGIGRRALLNAGSQLCVRACALSRSSLHRCRCAVLRHALRVHCRHLLVRMTHGVHDV